MNKEPEALRLAERLEQGYVAHETVLYPAADELRRLHHNNLVLTDALWKSCGDDEEIVNATIESQGELK